MLLLIPKMFKGVNGYSRAGWGGDQMYTYYSTSHLFAIILCLIPIPVIHLHTDYKYNF